MPGKVKVKIVAGRNLPVMDRSNDTTDAYVEVKLGSTTFKTDVCRKSLNPQWNSEWFRFEMDDLELQDEPLQIRLMDHDTYSANDAIGKVYLDLNPLLLTSSKDSSAKLISGWIPVYDTMHGIRGEVNLVVKVELFSDLNKFRQSSCGVMFFFTQAIPDGYFAHSIHGFVEELVVNDDPEYQWIDKIRTPRASNEARQTLFSKLSGEVQRRVGLKALELGGNTVIGYRQCFDLEGESGIVVRGIGTAATLTKQYDSQLSPSGLDAGGAAREFQSLDDGLLLPFSSHPTMLSKSSRSKRTGSRVPFSTHSMQETLLPRYGPPGHSFIHNRAPSSSASITAYSSSSSNNSNNNNKCMTSFNAPTSSSSTFSSSTFKNLLNAVSGRCDSHHRSHSDTSVVVHTAASEPVEINSAIRPEVRRLGRPTSLIERSEPFEIVPQIGPQRTKIKSIEIGMTNDEEKVKFRAGTESPSSSSGKDYKVEDADEDEGDNEDEERKLNEKENKFYLLIAKRARGSKKKDRYSKSSLLKRASMNFPDSKRVLPSKNKESFTDEITKYFNKKKKLLAGDKDDSSSLSESASPYRQVKSGLFRRRHKFQGRLMRCNSESFSLGETSVDSLPSIQSDLVFGHQDDTDISLESLPRHIQSSPVPKIISARERPEAWAVHSDDEVDNSLQPDLLMSEGEIADPESTARVIDAVMDLGYSMEKPVKLYISSADALLVVEPSRFESRDTNILAASNHLTSSRVNDEKIPSINTQMNDSENQAGVSSSGSLPMGKEVTKMMMNSKLSYSCLSKEINQEVEGMIERKEDSHLIARNSTTATSIGSSCSATTQHSTSSSIMSCSSSNSSGLGHGRPSVYSESSDVFGNISSPTVRVIPPDKATNDRPVVFHLGPNYSQASEKEKTSACSTSLSMSVPKESTTAVPDNARSEQTDKLMPLLTSLSGHSASNINNNSTICSNSRQSSLNIRDVSGFVHENERSKEERSQRSHRHPQRRTLQSKSFAGRSLLKSSSSSSRSVVMTTDIAAVESSSFCANAANTTTTTSTATILDANVQLSLSSLKNASSTNMPPAPLPTASKNTSITNGGGSLGSTRQPCLSTGGNISNNTGSTSQSKQTTLQSSPKSVTICGMMNRRSSESDLSTPPKPGSTHAQTVTTVLASGTHGKTLTFAPMPPRRLITADHFEMLEYPFITLNQLPPGFIQHIGGTVSARSVKLLERITNLDEPESRDSWWTEIRMEIRSHARSIGCNVVLGYEEQTTMCDDVCVLSASGTAAVLSGTLGDTCEITIPNVLKTTGAESCGCLRTEKEKSQSGRTESVSSQYNNCSKCSGKLRHGSSECPEYNCSLCHIPYSESSVPFPVKMTRCLLCRKGKVPDILLATIDLPVGLQCYGKSCLIQAQVFRPKKDCKGEISAKEVSDSLPFLEYELHRRLINKLKVRGMNAIFALQVQICLGEKMMVGLATGTAVFVSCLPQPSVPKISAGNLKTDSQKVVQFQKVVQEVYERNREVYDLKNTVPSTVANGNQSVSSDGEDSDEDLPDIDLATGNKDTYVLEVDDAEDIDIIQVLIDPSPELGFYMNNTNFLHGFEKYRVTNQQMFTQLWRCRISPLITLRQFTNYFDKLLQAVAFKLRRISPCVLSKLRYRVELPEQDEIQLSIIGLAVRIEESKAVVAVETVQKNGSDVPDVIEPEAMGSPSHKSTPITICPSSSPNSTGASAAVDPSALLHSNSGGSSAPARTSSPGSPGTMLHQSYSLNAPKNKAYPRAVQLLSRPKCIEITPLSHISGGKIEKYLGNLNFFFIRESTSIRENGGLSGFVHSFIAEVLAIVRAHIAALGGNGMVSYFMTELALLHNPHKNQGQCLVNVGGDVVYAIYPN